jgi:hypothetical protein
MSRDGVGRNPPDLLWSFWTSERVTDKIRRRTSGIKQTQRIRVISKHNGDYIIVEDLEQSSSFPADWCWMGKRTTYRWDIFAGELVGVVGNDQTGLDESARSSGFLVQEWGVLTLATPPSPTTTHFSITCLNDN